MNFFIFLAILIIVLLYKPSMIEGFKPNEDQFSICDDRSEKGETNYHQEKNLIKENPTGFYTSLIRLTEEKNNPRYYKSPKCLKSRGFKKNYFNNNKVIDHKNNNWNPPVDPWDTHAKPDNNDSILYSKDLSDDFVYQHEKENQKEILSRSNYFSN